MEIKERMSIENIKETEFKVDDEFSHISSKDYEEMNKEEKKKIPLDVLVQIQRRDLSKKTVKYYDLYKVFINITLAFLVIFLFSLFNFSWISIISIALSLISGIITWRLYNLFDANYFAFTAMEHIYKTDDDVTVI